MSDPDRDLWIGDVIRVWRRLQLTSPEERAAAARALGFDASALLAAAQTAAGGSAGAEAPAAQAAATGPIRGATNGRGHDTPRVVPSAISVRTDEASGDALPAWWTGTQTLPPEGQAHATWRPQHQPLLRPQWTRHILSAMCSTRVAEGPLDATRLIEEVVRLRPIVAVPRRSRPTVRRGVQLLIEQGAPMLPFRRDVLQLIESLRDVISDDRIVMAGFERHPLDEPLAWFPGGKVERWTPPGAGSPVLLVSDLGITSRFGRTRAATPAEWLAFGRTCRAAGCTPIALLPHGRPFWPPALKRTFALVPWGHRTSVAEVHRALSAAGIRS